MSATSPPSHPRLAVDAMGADGGVDVVFEGLALAASQGLRADVTLHGREGELRTAMASRSFGDLQLTLAHAEDVISMEDKPTNAVRRGRASSMWSAISSLKEGNADAVVSSGNTGALMAMSVLQLRMIEGVDRPAISALWPTEKGDTVVLDVGANVEASAHQLIQFAIMGEAYFRALKGKGRPSVGLLNVGAEELKGHGTIRNAAEILRSADSDIAFSGFVEGNDISHGEVDVVVTDGFTGNVALKTGEGVARMVGSWVKQALTGSILSKIGAALMMSQLKSLKHQMNPSRVNGAPLLGLNGLVVKSHGGADAAGVAAALAMADRLARHPFQDEIARTVAKFDDTPTAAAASTHEPATTAS